MQRFFDEEPSDDLIENGFDVSYEFNYSISLATLSVKNENQAKKLQKEIGEYAILNSPLFFIEGEKCQEYTKQIFSKLLKKFIGEKNKKILFVGLGNDKIDADSFGTMCIDYLTLKPGIYAIKPNVYQNTNLMSYDIVDGVCRVLEPDLVVLIDSLGTNNIKRLACSFQLSNVGILPGGAMTDFNKIISKRTLGVPCVVIGVPFMVFARGLDKNLDDFYKDVVLTPKDIEEMIKTTALLVCDAIDDVC